MLYQFHVEITPEIYTNYNIYVATKSHYGKRQTRRAHLLFTIATLVLILMRIPSEGLTLDMWIGCIPLIAVAAALILLWPFFVKAVTKRHIKDFQKRGQVGYDAHADMCFYNDHFEEITTEKRMLQSYTALKWVEEIDGVGVCLFQDDLRGYILPTASFRSAEQAQEFLAFARSKIPPQNT